MWFIGCCTNVNSVDVKSVDPFDVDPYVDEDVQQHVNALRAAFNRLHTAHGKFRETTMTVHNNAVAANCNDGIKDDILKMTASNLTRIEEIDKLRDTLNQKCIRTHWNAVYAERSCQSNDGKLVVEVSRTFAVEQEMRVR